MRDFHKDIKNYLLEELDMFNKIPCTKEENEKFSELEKEELLPADVYKSGKSYFRYSVSDLSDDELRDLLLCRQVQHLKSIKNSMAFFVVLTAAVVTIAIIVLYVLH